MPKGDVPELGAAAQTIENDQKRLEELARALQKTKLQTEKNINRAARELQEALGQQESLAVSLRALGQAMVRMQERQQAAVNALSERATEIQTRRMRLSEHMIRYATLGSKAAELLEAMSAALGQPTQSQAVAEANAKLDAVVEEAAALSREARDEDFTEVAHEADVLKQKFQAIRTQLGSRKDAPN
jgi:chromosome segregation ATPase